MYVRCSDKNCSETKPRIEWVSKKDKGHIGAHLTIKCGDCDESFDIFIGSSSFKSREIAGVVICNHEFNNLMKVINKLEKKEKF